MTIRQPALRMMIHGKLYGVCWRKGDSGRDIALTGKG